MDDRLEDMIRDVRAEFFANAVFENISNDAEIDEFTKKGPHAKVV